MKRSPIKRKASMARKPMRRGQKRSAYATRPRDTTYMLWLKSNGVCAILQHGVPWLHDWTHCDGPIEADHMGRRPLGRKADDRSCGALCRQHHRERTDHCGIFKLATKGQIRDWMDEVVAYTQELYRREFPDLTT